MSLQEIQERLKAPKNQYNKFGNYPYRNLEDILNAVKPLLAEYKYSMIIGDEIVMIKDRVYVKATAEIFDKTGKIIASNTAFAREPENKKGMDESQITGATSSYARKYCANGLFLIDDTEDADSMDNSHQGKPTPSPAKEPPKKLTKKQPEGPVLATKEQRDKIIELGAAVQLDAKDIKPMIQWFTNGEKLTAELAGKIIADFSGYCDRYVVETGARKEAPGA